MSADQLLSFREQGGIRCDDQEVGNDVVECIEKLRISDPDATAFQPGYA